jgi:hypothetical protein
LTFDVFAEDENGLINNGQSPVKRPRRASKEEMLDGHEWQAQRIVGERQTTSGLEYEVRVEKTVWLPRGDASHEIGAEVQGRAASSD